ncbi:MAG: glycerophosphodiester phosphodiesterase family protein [Acholeplasmataceae bacterium]|jgi:glycerophosphoryl diester phosphodiesterase|nr:glycerophosphodiester phosphodiesterase family protein [Acholeplasmataceae bacterium]MDY0316364.1 glycerophosphodiester phosphodiesterase family protein [Acholeplasmatales bacterium]
MRKLKIVLIVLFFIVATFMILEYSPRALQYGHENGWKTDDRPLIIPHGGAKVLYPENTIYSFKQTEMYDAFEIDLTLTKDDVLMTHHDLDLGLDLGESYQETLVRSLTYNEIIDLIKDNDYPFVRNFEDINGDKPYENITDPLILAELVPAKLEDIFQLYPNKKYILEIKDTEIENDFKKAITLLIELIEDYELEENVIVSSFSDEVIEAFQKESSIHTSTAWGGTLKFVLLSAFNVDFFYRPKQAALIIPVYQELGESYAKYIKLLPSPIKDSFIKKGTSDMTDLGQKGIIEDAKRHNMATIYWTINDEETMLRLIELGVDGIITDRPDILYNIYIEQGIINP